MTVGQLTEGERQAYALYAVAQHLVRHPGLPPITTGPWKPDGRVRLQLGGDALTGLIMWAGSLNTEDLLVHRFTWGERENLNLHAHGRLTGRISCGHGYSVDVDAWAGVDALLGSPLANGDRVLLADLMVAATQKGEVAAALADVRAGGHQ